ncbi:hypothetical protein LCGC14_0790650 [marine sediment metagenome]|uniref:ComEC/Rec2-related protein domain-containing protein n=1 Tax=marine sediment metagenome TaxID=412755 RepID=A0A0F9PX07_9ZZZZ
MGLRLGLAQMMQQQRGHLVGWVPVCLAVGIGTYFAIGVEPSNILLFTTAAFAFCFGLASRFMPEAASPLIVAVALALLGFDIAAWRAHSMGAPVLGWRYYGPIEGRIVAIDRSQSDALRLTLDRVVLAGGTA